MKIDSSLSCSNPAVSLTSANQSNGQEMAGILNSGKGDVEVNITLSGDSSAAPDFKFGPHLWIGNYIRILKTMIKSIESIYLDS